MNIVREMIERKEVELEWCKGEDQKSDVLTKLGASGELLREVFKQEKLQ